MSVGCVLLARADGRKQQEVVCMFVILITPDILYKSIYFV
jgi:hypothetical protein